MTQVREAAVDGMFYPDDARELSETVRSMLSNGQPAGSAPKALIVPHAGYVYSGPVAATAYARLIAALDPALISISEAAHRLEHSLEVQLPFLQTALGEFTLVPLVVGDTTPESVAAVFDALWNESGTLFVVSSDLSHYLPYEDARQRDRATCSAIEQLDSGRIDHGDACGATAVAGLLIAAARHNLAARTLDLRNSGDTAGGREQVVGYGSWLFEEGKAGI